MKRLTTLALLVLWSLGAGAQTISVTPADARADQPVRIRVEGLTAGQTAIVRAFADDAAGTHWQSWTPAASNGELSMRVFTSMDVAGEGYSKRRFDSSGLTVVPVRLVLEIAGKAVAETVARRQIVAPDVTRADVRSGSLVGTLFTPPGPSRGAILVIGGSEGGIGEEQTAALLANHGYTALAIAYFGIDPLPKALAEIPLETFFAAIESLKTRAKQAKVSIVATSKGSEAALVVAARREDVAAVVAYAPSSVVWSCICDDAKSSWTLHGEPLPFIPPGRDPAYAPPPGFPITPAVHYQYRLAHAPAAARIEVERIKARIMLIAGDRDSLWPSAAMARQIAQRREVRALIFEGAGHLIAKSYLPAGSTLVGNGRIDTGGDREANARAQAQSWPAVLEFLSP